MVRTSFITLDSVQDGLCLGIHGDWSVNSLQEVYDESWQMLWPKSHNLTVDASRLERLDSSGVVLLSRLLKKNGYTIDDIDCSSFSHSQQLLIRMVVAGLSGASTERFHEPRLSYLQGLGKGAIGLFAQFAGLCNFLGQFVVTSCRSMLRPKSVRWVELTNQLQHAFVEALFIVGLLMLLIGVVVAYLFAIQIEKFGANIFVVDGVSTALCRELSPVIVAIIVAGRSGSAFTAQIGAMNLNEEVDALRVMGLDPQRILVFPRVVALCLALPLLVFVGDVVGILGGMLVADLQLGIEFSTFLDRLQGVLQEKSVYIGLFKAPVFALFIGTIGCRMGMVVENTAQSVGENTTKTVVQSIVSVILLNAFFATTLARLGW